MNRIAGATIAGPSTDWRSSVEESERDERRRAPATLAESATLGTLLIGDG